MSAMAFIYHEGTEDGGTGGRRSHLKVGWLRSTRNNLKEL